jgi:ATP-dependent DNA ligase
LSNPVYYAFDLMVLAGKDVMSEPLMVRRQLLQLRELSVSLHDAARP